MTIAQLGSVYLQEIGAFKPLEKLKEAYRAIVALPKKFDEAKKLLERKISQARRARDQRALGRLDALKKQYDILKRRWDAIKSVADRIIAFFRRRVSGIEDIGAIPVALIAGGVVIIGIFLAISRLIEMVKAVPVTEVIPEPGFPPPHPMPMPHPIPDVMPPPYVTPIPTPEVPKEKGLIQKILGRGAVDIIMLALGVVIIIKGIKLYHYLRPKNDRRRLE